MYLVEDVAVISHNTQCDPILKKYQYVKDILSFWGTFCVCLVKSVAVMSHNTQCDPNFKKISVC